MKVSRADTDSDHAERVPTRKNTIAVQSSEFQAEVRGELILLGAKGMRMIHFGNVGQCVFGRESSSAKSVVGRHVLLIQERVRSGEIRTEKWKREYNTADNDAQWGQCRCTSETCEDAEME